MKHEFIARCSSLGALMTNPRAKSETLSETAKKEIEKVVLFNKYGIEEDFSSKPTLRVWSTPERSRRKSTLRTQMLVGRWHVIFVVP